MQSVFSKMKKKITVNIFFCVSYRKKDLVGSQWGQFCKFCFFNADTFLDMLLMS